MCIGMANGGKTPLTKEEIKKKFDNEFGTIIINDIKIVYDSYTIENKNGKDIVHFYNESGFCFIASVFLEDIKTIDCYEGER